MKLKASINNGRVSSITVKRSNTAETEVASFVVGDSQAASLSYIFTKDPRRLSKAIDEVLSTEYVDEVQVFDSLGPVTSE